MVDGTGISAAEVDAMTARDVLYWWNCIMAFRKATAPKGD